MSYYKGEEVAYIGTFKDMGGFMFTDISTCTSHLLGGKQYYFTLSVRSGDIVFICTASSSKGRYYKIKYDYTFTSVISESYDEAEADLIVQVFDEVNNDKIKLFDYLGDDFTLSELTDESLTEKPTQPPTEAELPTGGEVPETSYDFSSLTIKNVDEIVNNSMGVVPSMIVAVVPLAIVAFSIGFGIKKALSYFRTVGRGGH